jgi:hypothetical protein
MKLFNLTDYLEELDSDYELIFEFDVDGNGHYCKVKLEDVLLSAVNETIKIRFNTEEFNYVITT